MNVTTTITLLFALVAVSVSAQATNNTQEIVHIAVLTLLKLETPIPASELKVIDAAMKATDPLRDALLAEINNEIPTPPTRHLRKGQRMLNCHPCKHVAASFPGCWINGVFIERCDRALSVYEELSDEEISELNETDRRRHLQVAVLCDEAKVGVSSIDLEKEISGDIPMPEGGEFIEKCLYSYA